jgi:hypothetical protein
MNFHAQELDEFSVLGCARRKPAPCLDAVVERGLKEIERCREGILLREINLGMEVLMHSHFHAR